MSADLFRLLAEETGNILSPLQRAVEVPGALNELFAILGVPPGDDNTAVSAAVSAIVDVKKQIEALASQEAPSLDDILGVLQSSGRAFQALRQLDATGGPLSQLPGVSGDLIEWLVSTWLKTRYPVIHEIAALLTLIELEVDQAFSAAQMEGTEVIRNPYRIERLHPSRIASLLRDPVGVLRAEYGTPLLTGADADAMADALFPKVVGLLSQLGVSCRYGVNPGDETLLADSAPYISHALIAYLNDPLLKGLESETGVVLSISSADRGDLGFVVSPFGTLTATRSVGPFIVELDITAGIDVFAVGRHGFTLLADASTTEVVGSVSAVLETAEAPGFVFGSPTGSRLEVGGARLAVETSLSEARRTLALSADVTKSALVISPGDGDGFLAELLPSDGLRAEFDLGLAWSSDKGLTLRGSAGLEAAIPVGLSVAGVTLTTVNLGLRANDDGVSAEVSASIAASIGPVKAVLDRVGIGSALRFPEAGGNLGVADLELGFKPPSGVGLSIDAQGVLTGGGFLFHDPARQLYAGAMQLSLHDEITLNAFGLIATRLPDGRPGYSMLIFITADGFKPVPLGFGFVLQSIGGMVGINRTFDHEVLRAGLKTDMLRTLLFPRDPVANAPALIQALSAAFPAKPGSYLLGLMARITWFTPALVQMDLALIRELGARERLLVLGRASALLPSADNDLIRLNMDALGVLDFDAGTLEADAVLVDSRLVHKFPITGSAALRARWPAGGGGLAGSHFVLAVGGLNPRFAAPAGFPTLDRVAIALSSGENPRLICDAYFAITPNTVQFGARASLYAKGAGFTVTGDLGFDALVTIVPPHFIVDFHALVQLKYKSRNLFKVALDGTLEGPLPLRIAAKAKFKILWFSFTVRFAFTLADGSASRSIAAISLETELEKALTDSANWSTRRAPGVVHGVALRSLPANAGLVLDPLGQLVVQQQVVPLNTHRDIDTYGGAPIAGRRRFTAAASLNGKAGTPVTGAFAPARYFTMSDDEKLAAPSFEEMDAGFVVGDTDATFDENAVAASGLNYEPITVNPSSAAETAGIAASFAALPATQLYTMPLAAFQAQRSSGAAARAPVRHVGRARFRNTAVTPAATLSAPRWRIIRASDGAPAPLDPGVNSWSDCRAALADLNRGGVRWLMVPAHELEAL
ncbi:MULTISPECIES: DUF6603 domain-containing protein [Methylocaldum]|uniref:DUF6603 domain-containing protein n=1 Tax=Methylocaldum sp. GT1BB TaxID=3438963 RepID=UPI0012EC6ACB|nr:hypothetical protein [Methylocaldum sp. BRCS4]